MRQLLQERHVCCNSERDVTSPFTLSRYLLTRFCSFFSNYEKKTQQNNRTLPHETKLGQEPRQKLTCLPCSACKSICSLWKLLFSCMKAEFICKNTSLLRCTAGKVVDICAQCSCQASLRSGGEVICHSLQCPCIKVKSDNLRHMFAFA